MPHGVGPQAFHDEARWQRCCQGCGSTSSWWDAHHVVERQEVKRRGLEQFDARNALRLCNEQGEENCHGGQTTGLGRIRLRDLTDASLDYAFEVLGPFAFDYLRRRYTGDDPRLHERLDTSQAPR